MQGWRNTQEDAHLCAIDIAEGVSLFGVFDGHGGIPSIITRFTCKIGNEVAEFA